jgi:hypothetical protein
MQFDQYKNICQRRCVMGLFDNFFNIFRSKNGKRNNTENNRDLTNMKDTHVSFGEDPGSIGNSQDEEK